jgi:hypothetical protein
VIVPVHVDVPFHAHVAETHVADDVYVLHGVGVPEHVPPPPEEFAVQVQPSARHWAE